MKKLLLTVILGMLFCSATTSLLPDQQEKATCAAAIENAIENFLECRLSKKGDVFSVGVYEKGKYDRYEISDDLIVIEIGPVETNDTVTWFDDLLGEYITYHPYFITLADTLGSTRLPTRQVIKKGELFYWYDSDYGLTEETIEAFLDFNLAERIDLPDMSYLGLIGKHQDFIKGATYYFCKDDLRKYKRVITSVATGWYEPPKVRCKSVK